MCVCLSHCLLSCYTEWLATPWTILWCYYWHCLLCWLARSLHVEATARPSKMLSLCKGLLQSILTNYSVPFISNSNCLLYVKLLHYSDHVPNQYKVYLISHFIANMWTCCIRKDLLYKYTIRIPFLPLYCIIVTLCGYHRDWVTQRRRWCVRHWKLSQYSVNNTCLIINDYWKYLLSQFPSSVILWVSMSVFLVRVCVWCISMCVHLYIFVYVILHASGCISTRCNLLILTWSEKSLPTL